MSRPGRGGRGGQVRVIGGAWRGRRLSVADAERLRPTPDRVRETLFNWLAPVLEGARCLDLFAGTGVLGFEAESRGAAQVVMVERDPRAVAYLLESRDRLRSTAEVVRDDVPRWLEAARDTFEVIFLDPPYGGDLLERSLGLVQRNGLLAAGGRLYMESGGELRLPSEWRLIRQGRAGQVRFALAADAA